MTAAHVEITERTCLQCGETKPLERFAVDKRCTAGRRPTCHSCYNERKRHSTSNLLRMRSGYNRRAAYKQRYGVTLEWYEEAHKAQGGLCAICGRDGSGVQGKTRLCIDHCHTTGQIRGLLCGPCNRCIGQMQDNPETFERAADYLRRNTK